MNATMKNMTKLTIPKNIKEEIRRIQNAIPTEYAGKANCFEIMPIVMEATENMTLVCAYMKEAFGDEYEFNYPSPLMVYARYLCMM